LKGFGDFTRDESGPNIHFGVREHAMGAILNGMALSGALVPYAGTFLIFSDYMRPPIRLAALMGLRTVYVFTHDSIGLGEDGPTHQPVEQLATLRAIPGLTVIRPADAGETAAAWKLALGQGSGPVALSLTRQKVPVLDVAPALVETGVAKGAYIVTGVEDGAPDIIIIATGSEVHLALGAALELQDKGVRARVVSMPSCELFDAQDEDYRNSVLPPDVRTRLVVEAGSTMGWHRYAGDSGAVIGIDRFGASAPATVLFEKFGFTVENVAKRALELVEKNRDLC
jgi:transketolase